MLGFILSKIGLVLIFAVAGFAWWKGGAGEREGALAVVVAWIVSLATQALSPVDNRLQMLAVVDGGLALAMLAIALRYTSVWLGIAMLLQGAVLAVHSLGLGKAINLREYYIALNLSSTAMLLAMVFATIGSWIKRSKRTAKVAPAPPSALAGAA